MSLATIELYLLKDCVLLQAFYVPECSVAVALVMQGGWDTYWHTKATYLMTCQFFFTYKLDGEIPRPFYPPPKYLKIILSMLKYMDYFYRVFSSGCITVLFRKSHNRYYHTFHSGKWLVPSFNNIISSTLRLSKLFYWCPSGWDKIMQYYFPL